MPFVAVDPLDWPDKYERWAETSYDGSVVFVRGIEKYAGRSLYRFQADPRPGFGASHRPGGEWRP